MSAEEIAQAFVNHFYSTLGTNPAAIVGLYRPNSTLTFEGQQVVGGDAIAAKYQSLGGIAHNIPMLTKDVQLSVNEQSLIVFVTGQLKLGGQPNYLLFSQMFQLAALAPGEFYVHNEIFRLIYG